LKLRDLAELSCRILSITVLIRFVYYSQIFVTYFNQNDLNQVKFNFLDISITPALLLSVSIILWLLSKQIAGLMVNESASINHLTKIDYKKFRLFVFSIIGLIILTQAVPSLIKMLFNIFTDIKRNAGMPYTITTFDLGTLIEDVLKTIIGLVLIMSPKKISTWIKRTRTIGTDFEERDEVNK